MNERLKGLSEENDAQVSSASRHGLLLFSRLFLRAPQQLSRRESSRGRETNSALPALAEFRELLRTEKPAKEEEEEVGLNKLHGIEY